MVESVVCDMDTLISAQRKKYFNLSVTDNICHVVADLMT